MRFFTMRRLAACMGALLLVSPPLLTGCDDYDDSELWQNVNDLRAGSRLSKPRSASEHRELRPSRKSWTMR